MTTTKTVPRSVLMQSLSLIAVLAIPLGLYLLAQPFFQFQRDVRESERAYTNRKEWEIKGRVQDALALIEHNRSQIEKRTKYLLRQQVETAHAIAKKVHEQNKERMNKLELESVVRETLRVIRYNNGQGYFFATDFDGVEQLFVDRPELEGENLLERPDPEGKYIRDMIEIARSEKGEGFYSYLWSKPKAEGTNFQKLAYVKRFEPFDWFIGTGEYLDTIEKQVRKETAEWLNISRFGQDDYLFAFRYGGDCVAHGGGLVIGENYWNLEDTNGVKVYQELQRLAKQGGGFVEYLWRKPSSVKTKNKLSYVEAFEPWGWVIGMGVYMEDVEEAIVAKRGEMKKSIWKNVAVLSIVLLVAILVALRIAIRFSRGLQDELDVFLRFFDKSGESPEEIDSKQLRYDEFRVVAQAGNEMIANREEAKRGLQESEERAQLSLEGANLGMWDWNVETGDLAFNERWAQMLGYALEEIDPNLSAWEKLLHPEDMPGVQEVLNAHVEGKTDLYEAEYRLQHKSGEWVWVLDKGKIIERDAYGKPLRLCGTHLDITDRKQAEKALTHRAEFERLMSEISSNFVELTAQETDTGINRALASIGAFTDVDRVYLFLLRPDERINNTHEWCAEGVEPQIEDLKDLPLDTFPWWMEKLNRFEHIHVPRVADLPPEADAEKGLLQAQNIQSVLVVPLYLGESLLGFLGFDSVLEERSWSDADIALLRTTAEIITSALNRKQAEKELRLNESRLEALSTLGQMTSTSFQEIADFAFNEAVKLTNSAIGYLAFLNKDETVLTMHRWSESAMAKSQITDKPLSYPVESTGPWGEAVRQRKPIITNNCDVPNPLKKGYPEEHARLIRHMNIPVFEDDRIVAVVGVGNKKSDYDNTDVRQLNLLMEGMWRLFQRKRKEEALEKRIVALTQPLDESASITFENLFNQDDIQRLQDEFANATGVASMITQPDGTAITAPSNFCRLCSDIIRKTDKGRSNCVKSDAAQGCYNPDGPIIQPCMSSGLWEACATISVDGKHIANWLVGQVRDETQTEEKIREYAREIEADEEAAVEAFRAVPVMSSKQFKQISKAVFTLANQLSSAAYQNVLQARFITERKRTEEKLAYGNALMSTQLESSPDGILVVDPEGKWASFNKRFTEMWEIPKDIVESRFEELALRAVRDKLADADEFMNRIRYLYEHPEEKSFEEIALTDGRTFERHSSPMFGPERQYYGRVWFFRDITERKSLKDQVRQAQKMEAIGTLAGGIAHDFNNILSVIIGYLALALDEEFPLGNEAPDFLKQAQKASLRAADLTAQILSFSRRGKQERKLIQINPIVKEVLKLLRASIPAMIEIKSDIEAKPVTVWADPVQIHQIIMNLCVNASYAMRNSVGNLMVRLTVEQLDDDAVGALPENLTPGPYAKLTISDTGPGMSPEVMERIFDPFYTTKPKGKGTGMGLAVVYGIVGSHGGVITVSSQPGEGATFDVFLPVERNLKQSMEKENLKSALPRGNGERILLVDDEYYIVDLETKFLRHLGYHVVSTESSEEAFDLFSSNSEKFDIVVTDQTMPKMTGDQLAKKILSIRPGIPIILCTGFSERFSETQSKNLGIREYLMKPIPRRQLAETVANVLKD